MSTQWPLYYHTPHVDHSRVPHIYRGGPADGGRLPDPLHQPFPGSAPEARPGHLDAQLGRGTSSIHIHPGMAARMSLMHHTAPELSMSCIPLPGQMYLSHSRQNSTPSLANMSAPVRYQTPPSYTAFHTPYPARILVSPPRLMTSSQSRIPSLMTSQRHVPSPPVVWNKDVMKTNIPPPPLIRHKEVSQSRLPTPTLVRKDRLSRHASSSLGAEPSEAESSPFNMSIIEKDTADQRSYVSTLASFPAVDTGNTEEKWINWFLRRSLSPLRKSRISQSAEKSDGFTRRSLSIRPEPFSRSLSEKSDGFTRRSLSVRPEPSGSADQSPVAHAEEDKMLPPSRASAYFTDDPVDVDHFALQTVSKKLPSTRASAYFTDDPIDVDQFAPQTVEPAFLMHCETKMLPSALASPTVSTRCSDTIRRSVSQARGADSSSPDRVQETAGWTPAFNISTGSMSPSVIDRKETFDSTPRQHDYTPREEDTSDSDDEPTTPSEASDRASTFLDRSASSHGNAWQEGWRVARQAVTLLALTARMQGFPSGSARKKWEHEVGRLQRSIRKAGVLVEDNQFPSVLDEVRTVEVLSTELVVQSTRAAQQMILNMETIREMNGLATGPWGSSQECDSNVSSRELLRSFSSGEHLEVHQALSQLSTDALLSTRNSFAFRAEEGDAPVVSVARVARPNKTSGHTESGNNTEGAI